MERLIDADWFRRYVHEQFPDGVEFSADDVLEMIDNQPTAYDVEKVVKELDEFANLAALIDKKALSEEIKSLTVHVTGLRAGKGVLSKFMDEYRKSVLRIIDEQPTITKQRFEEYLYEV